MGNRNLSERNCRVCDVNFSPLTETIFCRKCFDSPESFQHECYAIEAYARKLGRTDSYLTAKEMEEAPDLSEDELKVIRESIYGI
jgi:hypothetical protein